MFNSFFKVFAVIFLLSAGSLFSSCDKDDDVKEATCPYDSFIGQYVGHEQITGEWNGAQVLNAPIENALFKVSADKKTDKLSVVVPEIKNLVIEQMHFTINMPSFTIEGLEPYYTESSATSAIFGCDYSVEAVECDLGRGMDKYSCTGHAVIRIAAVDQVGGMELEYTFRLGNMPFELKASVFGVKQDKK